MKRCPNCEFPNTDSDVQCFKCGTALPEAEPITKGVEQEDQPETSQPTPEPTVGDTLVGDTPTFNAQENITTFIHTPTEAPPVEPKLEPLSTLTQEETCVTSDLPTPEPTPTPVTRPTRTLPPPTRILPKYKWLPRLGLISKILSILIGLVSMSLGIGAFLMFPSIFTLALGLIGLCVGLFHWFIGFALAALLNWLNDTECNQRRQQEILTHIYHHLPE